MTIRVDFAHMLQNTVVGTAQRTVLNATGKAIVKGQPFVVTNATGMRIGCIAAGDIANGARGEAYIHGEFSFVKKAGEVFEALDDIWWNAKDDEAVNTQAEGTFWIAKCTKASASTVGFVDGELGLPDMQHTSFSASSLSESSASISSTSSQSSDSSASLSSQSHSSESSESSDSSVSSDSSESSESSESSVSSDSSESV